MKLEMSTDFLHLIEPGMYGTELGEVLYEVKEEYIKDFKMRLLITVLIKSMKYCLKVL